jgi:hypothetical protein
MPLWLRGWFYDKTFRPSKKDLRRIALIAPFDISYFRIVGWNNSRQFVRELWQYRRNMKSRTWSSLTKWYPRAIYLWYYYQLFWWAKYCSCSQELLLWPDRSLIPELFLRYIIEIDNLIDHPGGRRLLARPAMLFNTPSVKGILDELLAHIQNTSLNNQQKRLIYHQVWVFRKNCLAVCSLASDPSSANSKSVQAAKEFTVMNLFGTWVTLLDQLYRAAPGEISHEELAGSSRAILEQVNMAAQMLDDMLDFPLDYREEVSNLFHELLKETPSELDAASRYVVDVRWKFLDWIWARENLPCTCRRAAQEVNRYLQKALAASVNQAPKVNLTAELCRMIQIWSGYALGGLFDIPEEESMLVPEG